MSSNGEDKSIKLIDIDQNFNRAQKIFLSKTPQMGKRKKKVVFFAQNNNDNNDINNKFDESHFEKVERKPNFIAKEAKEHKEENKTQNVLTIGRNESCKKKRKISLSNKKIKKSKKKISSINIIINKNINNNKFSNINNMNVTDKKMDQNNDIHRSMITKKPKLTELTRGIENQAKTNKNTKKRIRSSSTNTNINKSKNKKSDRSDNNTKGKENITELTIVKKNNSLCKPLEKKENKDTNKNLIGNLKKLFCCFN